MELLATPGGAQVRLSCGQKIQFGPITPDAAGGFTLTLAGEPGSGLRPVSLSGRFAGDTLFAVLSYQTPTGTLVSRAYTLIRDAPGDFAADVCPLGYRRPGHGVRSLTTAWS